MGTIYFAKLNEKAIIPSKDIDNMGYDIYACFEEDEVIISPFQTKAIPTGIASAVENGYGFVFKERSSTGIRQMAVGAGVIDSNYRGEWKVLLRNLNSVPLVISKFPDKDYGTNTIVYPYTKAIAQALLVESPKMDVIGIDYNELKKFASNRGDGMYGSTGK